MAKAEASVEELVSMIERGELRLPEMQRQYVWRSTRVRDLLDSLYRGYPSGAILLWSTAILRKGALSRGLGVYGCVLGAFGLIGVVSGHSMSSVHGFGGLVMLSQGIWYVAAGVLLLNPLRSRPADR